jgi:hypothetical protein
MNNENSNLLLKIEILRKKLINARLNNAEESVIIKISQELDNLITKYMKK